MRPHLPDHTSPLRTGLRFVIAAPVAIILALLVVAFPVHDGPVGRGNLVCVVTVVLGAPGNWPAFVVLLASASALYAYGVDRLLAGWLGGHGQRASAGLSAAVFVLVGSLLAVSDFGIFC